MLSTFRQNICKFSEVHITPLANLRCAHRGTYFSFLKFFKTLYTSTYTPFYEYMCICMCNNTSLAFHIFWIFFVAEIEISPRRISVSGADQISAYKLNSLRLN